MVLIEVVYHIPCLECEEDTEHITVMGEKDGKTNTYYKCKSCGNLITHKAAISLLDYRVGDEVEKEPEEDDVEDIFTKLQEDMRND